MESTMPSIYIPKQNPHSMSQYYLKVCNHTHSLEFKPPPELRIDPKKDGITSNPRVTQLSCPKTAVPAAVACGVIDEDPQAAREKSARLERVLDCQALHRLDLIGLVLLLWFMSLERAMLASLIHLLHLY